MTTQDEDRVTPVLNRTTRNDRETMDLAAEFARSLRPGDVVVLSGPIGAGKTYFAKGLADGLGVADLAEVNSPTYDLVHQFEGNAARLVHMDLYRVERPSDDDIEWAREYVTGERNIVAIEWGERIVSDIAADFYTVTIEIAEEDPDARVITITHSHGAS